MSAITRAGTRASAATKKNETRLLATLGEHGRFGTEAAQLSPDPEREQRIEERSINDVRTHRTDQSEAGIVAALTGGCPKHAYLELSLERVELVCERAR